MTFYLMGLGLDAKSISLEAIEACKKAERVYLECYTADLPYEISEIERIIGKKIIQLNREQVEGEEFVNEARQGDIAVLVYGSPLAATTHISLILKCKKEGINFRIIQNAGILNAIAETGLQLYKFGRTTSMPAWRQGYEPASFIDVIKENLKTGAHTMLLTDIGLSFSEALNQLEKTAKEKKLKLNKIVACSRLGTKESRIYYSSIKNLGIIKGSDAKPPFCFIIPGRMHFMEKEALELLAERAGEI